MITDGRMWLFTIPNLTKNTRLEVLEEINEQDIGISVNFEFMSLPAAIKYDISNIYL
jgi:hypothetical protein